MTNNEMLKLTQALHEASVYGIGATSDVNQRVILEAAKAFAAAASAEPVAWQPIETAPMDGTDVLIAAYGRAAEAWYSDSSHRWLWANGEPVLMTVTHWMPLPKGPANE